ncbi:MAG TPA: hypothetical protein PLL10_09175 [Elusimicrobiales bacterium]|nr:hypothetical protein [Elusimicrobiales bacterium]
MDETVTLFEAVGEQERNKAIQSLMNGKTPITEVRKRPMRGGGEANYVNTYYMTRQLSLITGFRWASEYLEDKARPNWESPIEVGVKVKVTIWDKNGTPYSHTCWGGKDVVRYTKDDPRGNYKAGDIISLFDDLKAAESDAIKKCISYFGVANDIYGGKELEYFATDSEEPSIGSDAMRAFGKFLSSNNIMVSKACSILEVGKLSEISDFRAAYEKIKEQLGI